ncbi:MAG TPA: hypothetical protein VHY08_24430 [Bacillota bacterium]|nr:hypothetical protein [Bacillota bacterium]
MDTCQSIRQYLLDHFSMSNLQAEKPLDQAEFSVKEHLLHCASCRLFLADLTKIGEHLNDLETKITDEIQVPPLAFFDSLVTKVNGAEAETNVKTFARTPELTEVLAFLGTGVTLLSGIGLLLQMGLVIPVAIFFGLISALLPLMILIDRPGIGNREVS